MGKGFTPLARKQATTGRFRHSQLLLAWSNHDSTLSRPKTSIRGNSREREDRHRPLFLVGLGSSPEQSANGTTPLTYLQSFLVQARSCTPYVHWIDNLPRARHAVLSSTSGGEPSISNSNRAFAGRATSDSPRCSARSSFKHKPVFFHLFLTSFFVQHIHLHLHVRFFSSFILMIHARRHGCSAIFRGVRPHDFRRRL